MFLNRNSDCTSGLIILTSSRMRVLLSVVFMIRSRDGEVYKYQDSKNKRLNQADKNF
jgi:hypothetical protein